MKPITWHWPDRIIRLRGSRRLRDEHNATINHYEHEMKQLVGAVEALKVVIANPSMIGGVRRGIINDVETVLTRYTRDHPKPIDLNVDVSYQKPQELVELI